MFWPCIVAIVFISTVIPSFAGYKKQKLIEERKTNNLALAYQILSARPDLTMNDVEHLLKMSESGSLIEEKNN